MAEDTKLRDWVSDNLYDLLGYSLSTLVSFVIGLAKKASSSKDLALQFYENNFPVSNSTEKFAEELYCQLPHKKAGLNIYQKAEKDAVDFARKQQEYKLLDADDDEDEFATTSQNPVKRKQLRKRKQNKDDDEDSDPDMMKSAKKGSVGRKDQWQEVDEEDVKELEREQDQREKEELEMRLRQKDESATRKVVEPKLTRRQEEELKRRSEAEERGSLLPTLREVSRQEYLKMREQKKLDELRDALEDEQYLFEDVKLTAKELEKLRYQKTVYELAKKRAKDLDNIIEYRMPEAYDQEGKVKQDKRFAVALERYRNFLQLWRSLCVILDFVDCTIVN